MKGLFLVFVLTSQFLVAQNNNNIAIFHAKTNAVTLNNSKAVSVSVAPFSLVNGLVLVKATINGKYGDFILDTGSPGIVLNSEYFTQAIQIEGTGIGGQLEIGEIDLTEFKWGGIEKRGVKGLALNIRHLEKTTGRQLMGLIGYDVFHDHEIFFDYPNEVIKIYSFKIAEATRVANPDIVIPFFLNNHVPTIATKINGKKAYLGIDSGAGVNVIDDEFFGTKGIRDVTVEIIVGLDQNPQGVNSAVVSSLTVKNGSFDDIRCHFMDMSPLKSQFEGRIDGILGYPFLKNYSVAINYKEQKVFIWY